MYSYNLMTLNAAAMLEMSMNERAKTGKISSEFRYRLDQKTTRDLIISSTSQHSGNALYYQLIESVYGAENVNQYLTQPNCINKVLFYVDFRQVFTDIQKQEKNIEKREITNSIMDSDMIEGLCKAFIEKGFSMVYEDGESRSYIPFDKSSSMSRNYSMTFIDKEAFEDVDNRLRLGIDFSSIQVIPSKYYNYRGLYLTDGSRIPENEEFILNHKTVLVIDDDSHQFMMSGKVQEVPVITAVKIDGKLEVQEKVDSIRLNGFDGEGLVSPAYAAQMNQSKRREVFMKDEAVSFQIRMPFVKGMLHQVDFHRFFADQMPENDYYIKDLFGIPRRLNDVQIILTKSMFKCAGWLEDYKNINPDLKDPMEWYFDQFHKYDHALYVGNTDANMGSKYVPLNYQFLNTLDISFHPFNQLIQRHLHEAHSISKTGSKYAVGISEYYNEAESDDMDILSSVPTWRYALDLNSDFVRDPFVRKMLKMDENTRVKDLCIGRIMVEGTLKYLSGDLLAFLIHMIYNRKAQNEDGLGSETGLGVIVENEFRIDTKSNQEIIKKLKTQLIRTGKFYVADHSRLQLSTDKRYSVLRSPHLSRNEQCSLRPYIPDAKDKQNIYNRYFSHLKNVIMLPYESVDVVSLGGADFDGDMVKLILNREVNSAVLKGAYILQGKDYKRKLPVVVIPALKANRQPVSDRISYQLVKATFANQVGLISDIAIKIGKKEYVGDEKDSTFRNKCAECTLATGLEIDAVKTGVRPDLTELKKSAPGGNDYYLNRARLVKAIKEKEIDKLKVSIKKKTGMYGGSVYTAQKAIYSTGRIKQLATIFDAEYIPADSVVPNIDRLPGCFLKNLFDEKVKAAQKEQNKKNTGELLLFKFQIDKATGKVDQDWAINLKNEPNAAEKLEKMSALIKAYRKIEGDYGYIRHLKNKAATSRNMGKVYKRMQIIYDFGSEDLPITHTDISLAIDIAHKNIRDIFETVSEVDAAIQRMKDNEWIFAEADNREAVLYRILRTESLDEETKEILLTKEEYGFDFLKFYLYEVRNEIITSSSVDETDLENRKVRSTLEGFSDDAYKAFLKEFIAGQTNKEPKKSWNSRVVSICRKKLASSDMFNNDFDCALKYYYACQNDDPSRNFMWEVFQKSEILRNIFVKSN